MPSRDPVRDILRNLALLNGLERGLRAEILSLIGKAFDDIAGYVGAQDPAAHRRRRMRNLARQIDRRLNTLAGDQLAISQTHLQKVGVGQSAFAADQLSRLAVDLKATTIAPELIDALLNTNPIEGKLLRDWFTDEATGTGAKIMRQVRLGMTRHETTDQIIRRVRGKRGVSKKVQDGAAAIVRTSVTDIANQAALATYQKNDDITSEYEYVATLDSRTTDICIGLDRKRFRYDDPNKRLPPQHINCRSHIVPVVDWKRLGIEPPTDDGIGARASGGRGRTRRGRPITRGPVDGGVDYSTWLRGQSKAAQNEILGRGRAELFRAGKLPLSKLVRADGSRRTLAELRKL